MSECCSFAPEEAKKEEYTVYTDELAEQFAKEVGVDPRPNETLVEIDERGAFIRQPNAFIQPFGDKPGDLKAEDGRYGVGKIERVCVVREKQKDGYGRILIEEAEKWLLENGVKHIVINSQDRAAGFYNKLGYVTNPDVSPAVYEVHKGEPKAAVKEEPKEEKKPKINLGFTCVLVEKYV